MHLLILFTMSIKLLVILFTIKTVSIPLGLAAAAAVIDTAIPKKMFVSGMTALIIPNEEINDIMKIVKSLEQFCLLIKDVSETIKKEAK